jgi:hypothetical protein
VGLFSSYCIPDKGAGATAREETMDIEPVMS